MILASFPDIRLVAKVAPSPFFQALEIPGLVLTAAAGLLYLFAGMFPVVESSIRIQHIPLRVWASVGWSVAVDATSVSVGAKAGRYLCLSRIIVWGKPPLASQT